MLEQLYNRIKQSEIFCRLYGKHTGRLQRRRDIPARRNADIVLLPSDATGREP